MRTSSFVASSLLLLAACGGAPRPATEAATHPAWPTRVHGIAVGRAHACARHEGGTVSCWGEGSEGQLGDGHRRSRPTPVGIEGLDRVAELAAGSAHTCARTDDGSVLCWGSRAHGQLGDGQSGADASVATTPTLVAGLSGVTQISAGFDHTCAIKGDGTAWCWGDDLHGQLGRGEGGGIGAHADVPTQVAGLSDIVEIRCGGAHTCARTRVGAVWCWGHATDGQVGEAGSAQPSVISPVQVPGITDAVELALGDRHSCARDARGFVACWGDNGRGQLGDGTTTSRPTPMAVPGLAQVEEVDAGRGHTCARLSSREVRCWGENDRGQLGDGTTTGSPSPSRAVAMMPTQIAAGGASTCAIDDDGDVRCWGDNGEGQLGRSGSSATVAAVLGLGGAGMQGATVLRSGGDGSCARIGDTWRCWGDDAHGQLGDGAVGVRATPVLASLAAGQDLFLGPQRSCAIHDGALSCWGRSASGGIALAATPVDGGPYESVRVATHFACALRTDHTVACWGENLHGELGNGTTTASATPVVVSGLTDVSDVVVGDAFACALHGAAAGASGRVACWGAGQLGQLGDGARTDRPTPADLADIGDATAIVAGLAHACALRQNGGASCWGDDRQGQLGDATHGLSARPVQVADLTNIAELTAGVMHTCARTPAGEVWCWGANRSGQLATRGEDDNARPVRIGGVVARAIAAGNVHTCALTDEGVSCWGGDASGQLGLGTAVIATSPVRAQIGPPPAAAEGETSGS
jgi:alpha-tubulin suppressor-like RCC1 family protein